MLVMKPSLDLEDCGEGWERSKALVTDYSWLLVVSVYREGTHQHESILSPGHSINVK